MKISQRLHKFGPGSYLPIPVGNPMKGHTTWEMMGENKFLGSWSQAAESCLYAKILELCRERIPEIHTTRRLKPLFVTSGFKYSLHRQTNSQKTPGKNQQPCPFSQ